MRPVATWKLVALGLAAVAVSGVLVLNQILVAQARGIDHNLGAVADHLEAANATVGSILGKASVTPKMDRQVGAIGSRLLDIDTTLARTNRTLARSARSAARLTALTRREARASAGMESSLAAASSRTGQLSSLLGDIVPISRATQGKIARIRAGSAATAASLNSITAKLNRYGLPPAR